MPTAPPVVSDDAAKMRKALKLLARALRLQARYDRTLACARPLRERAEALRREVSAIEQTLAGEQLAELQRARHEASHACPGPRRPTP